MEYKICTQCGIEKEINEKNFEPKLNQKKDKYRVICRRCVNDNRKNKYISVKKIKIKEIKTEDYSDITPEKVKEYLKKTTAQKL